MNSRPATSAPFSERRSSLDCDHLDSEDFVSSEESHELHEADVSSTTREPGATRQSEAAVGGHEAPLVKAKAAKLLKGKEKEWESMVQRARPLQLLDLPVDILKEIIKEVSYAAKRMRPPSTILILILGHSHQRSHLPGPYPLRPTQSCYTLHLFEV